MKKFLFCCMLLTVIGSGLYAKETEEKQFKQYVEATQKSCSQHEGMTVCADYNHRIIYATMPIEVNEKDLLPQVDAAKKAMLEQMRYNKKWVDAAKGLKIQFVFTYITADKKVIPLAFSYNDL